MGMGSGLGEGEHRNWDMTECAQKVGWDRVGCREWDGMAKVTGSST